MAFTPEQMRLYRARKVEDGFCTVCLKTKAREGLRTCKPCQDKVNANRKKRRERYFHDRRCTECGIPVTGWIRTKCWVHQEEDNQRQRERWRKFTREGRCGKCGSKNHKRHNDGARF